MNESDEAAGRRADGRLRTSDRPKRWAVEPARVKRREDGGNTWWWAEPVALLFRTIAPTCQCGATISWEGPPKRVRGLHVYKVRCPTCGPDLIFSEFPLQVGGTAEDWREMFPWSDWGSLS